MKNIVAIGIIIISLFLLVRKILKLNNSWKKVNAKILGVNNINNNRIDYEYKVCNEINTGFIIVDDCDQKKILEKKKLEIYYNTTNTELSVLKVKYNIEDYLLGIISIIGGIYLYLYSCDEKNVISKIRSIASEPINNLRLFD